MDEDGRVYVVDQLMRKIDIFRPAALGEHDGYLGSKKPEESVKPGDSGVSGQTIPGESIPGTPAADKTPSSKIP